VGPEENERVSRSSVSDTRLIDRPQHDPDLLEEWARHILREQVAAGRGPAHPRPWLEATKRDLAKNTPAYVARVVNGLRARAQGRTVTGWREVRGTHHLSYVPDPAGTDRPPWIGGP
jgi:hypothetical protein